jgi:hypothetical protein
MVEVPTEQLENSLKENTADLCDSIFIVDGCCREFVTKRNKERRVERERGDRKANKTHYYSNGGLRLRVKLYDIENLPSCC